MKSLLTTVLLFFLTAFSGFAQTSQKQATDNYKLLEKSTMEITGTSTIHDWECEAEDIQMSVNFDASALKGDALNNPVKSLSLTVPVKSIKSGKGGMDSKIHGALKEKKHPNVTFNLTKADLAGNASTAKNFKLNVSGKLNIAGVSRDVSFPVEGKVQNDGTYEFTGSYKLDMTNYKIDPPTAIFGTIKSGKEVTISFDVFLGQ